MLNSRDIALLRPDVAANCRLWLQRCRQAGLDVVITNTVRDEAYQAHLYAQGRTRPGPIVTNGKVPTFHSVKAGLAFDFCENKQGKEYDNGNFFRAAAALAKEMGFSWGGDWRSFPDTPHIQWDAGGQYSSGMILSGLYPPDMPLWKEEETVMRYNTMAEIRQQLPWAAETIGKLIARGGIRGSGKTDAGGCPADMDLSLDMIRQFVIMDRMGLLSR